MIIRKNICKTTKKLDLYEKQLKYKQKEIDAFNMQIKKQKVSKKPKSKYIEEVSEPQTKKDQYSSFGTENDFPGIPKGIVKRLIGKIEPGYESKKFVINSHNWQA